MAHFKHFRRIYLEQMHFTPSMDLQWQQQLLQLQIKNAYSDLVLQMLLISMCSLISQIQHIYQVMEHFNQSHLNSFLEQMPITTSIQHLLNQLLHLQQAQKC